MNIYSDKLAHLQVVINCRYSVAHMCTRVDGLAYILGAPSIDDVMSYNSLTTEWYFIFQIPRLPTIRTYLKGIYDRNSFVNLELVMKIFLVKKCSN